jgi:hypothetical protein
MLSEDDDLVDGIGDEDDEGTELEDKEDVVGLKTASNSLCI